ncbi:MAG: chemotaxis protein CheV [Desulfovibrionaceae bacterium]|nr:chemotaxis protein CheV [Desulfovibrionaceae bacterium]
MSQQNLLHQDHNNDLKIIEFLIEEELPDGSTYTGHYGINVAKVVSIIRQPGITSLPSQTDSSVLGTFNLRGNVLPILDLAAWMGKKMVPNPNNKVIVTEFCSVQSAFLVSNVANIHQISWDAIEAPNRYVDIYSNESVTGVLRIGQKVLFILDMEKVLGSLDSRLDMSNAEVDTSKVDHAEQFHLLVADDSSSLRHIIKSALEKSGFKVTTAVSGRDAWEYLCSLEAEAQAQHGKLTDLLQLLISDIEMPEMDGHALTRKIRANPFTKDLPVILFSSLITDAVREVGVKAGADRQVSKPDLPGLNKIICELLEEKLNRKIV